MCLVISPDNLAASRYAVSAVMSSFTYRSLTPNKGRIRLINVLPKSHQASLEGPLIEHHASLDSSEPSDYISCTISHVSLEEAPTYTALSYHWGDTSRKRAILVNGTILSVSENLETVLRHLRLQDESITLWADAICIDQRDDVEKSEQVQKMRQIYSYATVVLAWLGPAADNSDVAMQWIEQFGRRSAELGIGTKPELQLRRLLERIESNSKDFIGTTLNGFIEDLKEHLLPTHLDHIQLIQALCKFLQRAYWSRIWVVQEVAVGSNTLFVCGTRMVSENALHHALRLLRNFRLHHLLKSGQDVRLIPSEGDSILSIDPSRPINLLKIRRAVEPSPLIYLMRSLRHFQATDPRDKVFALLGIASDSQVLGLRPDYRKSCEEVYTDVTRAFIQNGYIEILSLSESAKQSIVLPSWVPDWSYTTHRCPLQQRALDRSARPLTSILQPAFSASGLRRHVANQDHGDIPDRNTVLAVSGTFIGNVQRLGMPWEHECVGKWLSDLQRLSDLIPESLSQTSQQTRGVWRTAVADQDIRRGTEKSRLSEDTTQKVHKALQDTDLSLVNAQTLIGATLGDYCHQIRAIAQGRRPLLFSNGCLGIGPRETELGDLVYVLIGADVPYILRRQCQDDKFRIIGEAYVHGIMDGEAMEASPAIQRILIH